MCKQNSRPLKAEELHEINKGLSVLGLGELEYAYDAEGNRVIDGNCYSRLGSEKENEEGRLWQIEADLIVLKSRVTALDSQIGALQTDQPLNTYVWKEVLGDYTNGMVVVSAATVEMARRIAMAEYPDEAGFTREPTCISDRQQMMSVYGGG